MKKVLFFNLPVVDPSGFENLSLAPPFGIMYISSYAKEHADVQIQLADLSLQMKLDYHSGKETDYRTYFETFDKPDVLAISLMVGSSWNYFTKVVALCREMYPGTPIIVGGNHATGCCGYVLENGFADYVMCGEGEMGFLDYITTDKSPALIQGIYDWPKFQLVGPDERMVQLKKLNHMPDWSILDIPAYMDCGTGSDFYESDDDTVWWHVFTSRGCPCKCAYCAQTIVSKSFLRFYPNDKILDEMREMNRKYGVTGFHIADDMFNANKKRCMELLDGFMELREEFGDLKLSFGNGLYINCLDKEILDKMFEAGAIFIGFAPESGSPTTLKEIMRKDIDLERSSDLMQYVHQRDDVFSRTNIIIGLPRETKELLDETIDYITNLDADWLNINIYYPLPASPLYLELIEKGVIEDGPKLWANTIWRNRIFDMDGITAEEMNYTLNDLNLRLNFVENKNFKRGAYKKALHYFVALMKRVPGHIFAVYMAFKCYEALGMEEEAATTRATMVDWAKNHPYSQKLLKDHSHLLDMSLLEEA
ncbi:radical SAM protein [Pseudodesulfovibrio sp. zrk46]|uniref:B12-binding domain-containing radical SAM protein n=1 Tax=Pseudodesulfovibrio sp. zrk46 TaxID=2725288 RepID=UPI001449F103|nr:radical SAM protein [Pseudodesulfovibrio sp. zrk46]QJB55743.1 radical SAM protein [Pseudodesulfovibrio sp. zrk46]